MTYGSVSLPGEQDGFERTPQALEGDVKPNPGSPWSDPIAKLPAKAYYSVPPEYLGRSVWARWDSHTVRIFNHQFQQVEFHPRKEPGEFSTHDRNVPAQKRSGIERGTAYNLNQASLIGPQTHRWAEQMLQQHGIEDVRVLRRPPGPGRRVTGP